MKINRILAGTLAAFVAMTALTAPDGPSAVSSAASDNVGETVTYSYTSDPPDAANYSKPELVGEYTDTNGIKYALYSDNTASLKSYTGLGTTVTIPQTIESGDKTYTVTEISGQAFSGNINIRNVVLPPTVDSIGMLSFSDCTNLESITLSQELKSIGSSAFNNCTSLTSIQFPPDLEKLYTGAFCNCTGITAVDIPAKVSKIYTDTFKGCSRLATINVATSNTVYRSDQGVLYSKNNELVFYPEGKTSTEYTVLSGTTIIGNEALDNNPYLETLVIPDSVTVIRSKFHDCVDLKDIRVASGNPAFTSVDGVLYSKDMTHLIRYSPRKSGTTFTIPDTVVTVSDSAFNGCNDLVTIIFHNNVRTIYGRSFKDCENLKNISYLTDSESTPDIKDWDGIETFGNPTHSADFMNCTSLEKISIPNGVSHILYSEFMNCSSLTDVTLPESVISIDNGDYSPYKKTFEDCPIKKTIHGYDGSYAQYYAELKNFNWHSHGQASYIPILSSAQYNSDDRSVDLSWNGVFEVDSFDTEYKVYRTAASGGTPVYIGTATGKVSSYDGLCFCRFSDTSFSYNKKYYYSVTTVLKDGSESDFSNELSVELPPSAITPVIVDIAKSGSEVRVYWKAIDNAKSYKVYRSLTENDPVLIGSTTASPYSDKTWEPGKKYYYFVSSVMEDGTESALSKPFSFTTPANSDPMTGKPQISTISQNNGVVFISFNKNVLNAQGTNVYRSETLTGERKLIDNSYPYSIYADKTVQQGKTYFYWIRVIKADGTLTDFSDVAQIAVQSGGTTGNTISGTIPNFSSITGDATIQLINSRGTVMQTTVSTDGTYTFNNVTAGENYKLHVTMPKCAPRDYSVKGSTAAVTQNVEVFRYGDPDGDGVIGARDATQILYFEVGRTCCMRDKNGVIDEYRVSVAHVLPNSELSAKDATQILRYCVGKHPTIFDHIA